MDSYYLSVEQRFRRIEEKQLESLRASGFNIPKSKLGDFGNYMDAMRNRYHNKKMPNSDIIADIWESAESLNISGKTLLRHFNT